MEDKQAIKNMEYWKKKNNIPGIDTAENAGIGSGLASSSNAFGTTGAAI